MSGDFAPTALDYYLAALGLSGKKNSDERRRAALERAYEMRTFEIDLYWRRALYFWGFQAAIFTALGLTLKAGLPPLNDQPIPPALATLGALVALAHRLLAKGSSFWQRNWERHIDLLEDEFEGALYKTVWLQEGRRSYSPSRLNNALLTIFLVFWLFCLAFSTGIWTWISQFWKSPTVEAAASFPMSALPFVAAFAVGAVNLSLRFTKFGETAFVAPWSENDRPIKWRFFSSRPVDGTSTDTIIRRPLPKP